MKKKILVSILITTIFALAMFSIAFGFLINIRDINFTKEILKNYNDMIASKSLTTDEIQGLTVNSNEIRFTIVDSEGNVKYDSVPNVKESHKNRPEIAEALKNGSGYSLRNSTTTKERMIYFATKLPNGDILRSSVAVKSISFIENQNIKYTILIVLSVLLVSYVFSKRLLKAIVEPVNELQRVTSKIANGDFEMRVNIQSNDELGDLGKTFNEMANKLEINIREVKDKQSRLEAIVNSMQSGVIAIDKNNSIIAINPYAKEIFGINKDIIGADFTEYIRDFDINEILKEGDGSEKEIKILHPFERILKVKKASIINGYIMIGKVIAIQDITEMKRLENVRSQFVANVSHELKTPLTSIKGFSETLRYVDDEENKVKFLDIIDKEVERLTRLINDILVLSNLESNKNRVVEDFMPNEVVEEAYHMLKHQAEKKGIILELEQENTEFILGNRDKLLQLIINLVENGIKYSNEDGYVKIKTYNKNKNFFLKVEDNGIGIPKSDLPRIFERFYRVDKARKRGGTGLGLAIVKYIVKSFNGKINVESELGKGTIFTVEIRRV